MAGSPGRAVASGLASQTAATLPLALLGSQAPEMQDHFGFGDAALGAVVAAYFLVAGVGAPRGGRMVDRFGSQLGLRATSALIVVSLLVGAAAQSFAVIVVGMLVGAVATAIATPASNVVLVAHVPPSRRGVAFGIKQSSVPLAATLAGLAVPLVALTIGWRWSFLFATVTAVIAAVLAPADPADPDDPSRAAGAARPALGRPDPAAGAASGGRDRGIVSRPLVLMALVAVFAAVAVSTLNPFLVRAGTEAGFSTGAAGVMLSVAAAGLVASRIAWGFAIDRADLDPAVVVAFMISVGVVGFVLLATGRPVTFAVGALIAYGFGWAWPGVQFLAATRYWPDNPGEASGVVQLGAFTGATVGPLAFGVTVEAFDFSIGYLAAAVVAVVAATVAWLVARTSPARTGGVGLEEPSA